MGSKAVVKSRILFHFIKRKISLTPMETIVNNSRRTGVFGRIG
jgi:hypothetical protein